MRKLSASILITPLFLLVLAASTFAQPSDAIIAAMKPAQSST